MPKSLYVDPVATRAAGTIHFEDIPVCAYNKTIEEERANYSDADLVRINVISPFCASSSRC